MQYSARERAGDAGWPCAERRRRVCTHLVGHGPADRAARLITDPVEPAFPGWVTSEHHSRRSVGIGDEVRLTSHGGRGRIGIDDGGAPKPSLAAHDGYDMSRATRLRPHWPSLQRPAEIHGAVARVDAFDLGE